MKTSFLGSASPDSESGCRGRRPRRPHLHLWFPSRTSVQIHRAALCRAPLRPASGVMSAGMAVPGRAACWPGRPAVAAVCDRRRPFLLKFPAVTHRRYKTWVAAIYLQWRRPAGSQTVRYPCQSLIIRGEIAFSAMNGWLEGKSDPLPPCAPVQIQRRDAAATLPRCHWLQIHLWFPLRTSVQIHRAALCRAPLRSVQIRNPQSAISPVRAVCRAGARAQISRISLPSNSTCTK